MNFPASLPGDQASFVGFQYVIFPRMKLLSKRFLALLVGVQATIASPARAEESILHPDGVNTDAGWALSHVGMSLPGIAANSYAYPDTTVPVRLYLIDTGVSNPASFVTANPKLTFEGPIPVGGAVSVPRSHATQMLSLVAGKETGIAPGSPIHVVNYDIYTSGGAVTTTTITDLATAITKAIQHHRTSPNRMRAAICIATSSQTLTRSYAVEDSINIALAEGIPVIVSAGNLGQEIPVFAYNGDGDFDNHSYVPSAYGTRDGVICVGASDSADLKLSNSNFGTPVDILAPGLNVRTRSESATSAFVPMTGTSAAAALVAGAVLAELSINGSLTPAQVEEAINPNRLGLLRTTSAFAFTFNKSDGPVISSDSPVALSATAPPVAPQTLSIASNQAGSGITPTIDADGDGIPDMVEIFHKGSVDKAPSAPTLSRIAEQGVQMAQFKFPIAFDYFNRSTPFALGNGYTWGIRCTSNFKTWEVPVGSLSKTTDANGQSWLIATFPSDQPSCFVQIEIHPPAP